MTIDVPEIRVVKSKSVACDGGEEVLGHPKVYLNMGDEGRVECPYCDALFVLKDGPHDKGDATD